MPEEEEELRRTDDTFFRRLIATLLVAMVIEGGSFIYYYGQLVDRVDHIEDDIIALQSVQSIIHTMDKTLYAVSNKVDYLTDRIDRYGKTIDRMKTAQDKNSTIIKDAAEHIKQHGK